MLEMLDKVRLQWQETAIRRRRTQLLTDAFVAWVYMNWSKNADAAELEMGMLSSGSGGDERSNGVAALPGKVSVLAWCQLEAGRGAARGMQMS